MTRGLYLIAFVVVLIGFIAGVTLAAPIALVNASFEEPVGAKTVGDATWSNIPGWTASGPSVDTGIELFNAMPQPLLGANIAFLQSGDGSIFQTSGHTIAGNEFYQLTFYERNDFNATELTASLYYLNGATRVPFATTVFTPLTNVGRTGLLTQRILKTTTPVPGAGIGQLLGVELLNSSLAGGTGTWAWVDGVTLQTVGGLGDVNNDGNVDLVDFGIIRDHFQTSVTDRSMGDLNNDGLVNFADFREWKANRTISGGGGFGDFFGAVPEPSTGVLLLLLLGALLVPLRRRFL